MCNDYQSTNICSSFSPSAIDHNIFLRINDVNLSVHAFFFFLIFIFANPSERKRLYNFLKSEKPNFLERLKLAEAISSGLIYLHCHNLVHCNLTSLCIILDENNTPKFRGAGLIRVGA
ncbi:unnamed protein product [Rhizopus microsporus]